MRKLENEGASRTGGRSTTGY